MLPVSDAFPELAKGQLHIVMQVRKKPVECAYIVILMIQISLVITHSQRTTCTEAKSCRLERR
jgi:hypothetical protein